MGWHRFDGDRDWYDDIVVARCPCGDHPPIIPAGGDSVCETCGREYRFGPGRDEIETRGEGNGVLYTPTHGYSSIYIVRIG